MAEVVLKPGTILEGRYGVVRGLNVGGSSRIFEGRQLNLGTSIIIKTPREIHPDPIQDKQQIEHLKLEAHLLGGLRHRNLLTVYDVFVYQEFPIMICEYVDGRRLSEVVELAAKPIAARRVLSWAQQLLDCLFYLHTKDPPIIVRDLCPSNILLGKDGRLRLVDFGLVKRMDAKGAGTHQIVKGLGAEGYAPLEQTAFSRTGPPSDIYALGATIYFLLTKVPPASASSRVIASKDPLLDARLINTSLSDELWEVILRLMALRAQDRPQSVSEVKEMLLPISPEPKRPKGRCCVDCGMPLDIVSRQDIEVDLCPKCGGIWLDRDELEHLINIAIDDAYRKVSAEDTPTVELEPGASEQSPSQSRVWMLLRELLERTGFA